MLVKTRILQANIIICCNLGILFVCFTVDHKLLFGALTEQAVEDGFFFYTTFYNSPPVIKVCLFVTITF